MSKWDQNDIENRVRLAIESIEPSAQHENHNFGKPFITAYQLAILLLENDPELCAKLEKQLGGKGINECHSLSQYVANELSTRIKGEEIMDIEGVFLKTQDIVALEFTHDVISSAGNVVSLFRLKSGI